jgi:hypothetical protein
LHRQQAFAVETNANILELGEAFDEQTGANQQSEGQRHLNDHQQTSQSVPAAMPRGGFAALFVEAEMPGGGNLVFVSSAKTSRSGSLNGRDLSITPLTTLNSAVFAPNPSAIVIIATAVTPGFLSSIRSPNRTSRKTVSISASDEPLSSLIKLRLKQRLLFIIRPWPRAIECSRRSMAKRASTRPLFFLSKTLQNIGAIWQD